MGRNLRWAIIVGIQVASRRGIKLAASRTPTIEGRRRRKRRGVAPLRCNLAEAGSH